MKRPVSLHEFMPYGAPDLLGAERAHLSRALMVSSMMAAAAFLFLGAIVSVFPRKSALKPIPGIVCALRTPEPRVIDMRPPREVAKAAPAVPSMDDLAGRIEPVREDRVVLPEWWNDAGRITQQVQPGAGPEAVPGEEGGAQVTVDPDKPVDYVEELPVSATQVMPVYPQFAIQAQVEGKVLVLVLVGRDGRVREAKVDENRHVLLLDAAALEAARQWVFSPATVGGHPVAVWTAIPFHFKLQ